MWKTFRIGLLSIVCLICLECCASPTATEEAKTIIVTVEEVTIEPEITEAPSVTDEPTVTSEPTTTPESVPTVELVGITVDGINYPYWVTRAIDLVFVGAAETYINNDDYAPADFGGHVEQMARVLNGENAIRSVLNFDGVLNELPPTAPDPLDWIVTHPWMLNVYATNYAYAHTQPYGESNTCSVGLPDEWVILPTEDITESEFHPGSTTPAVAWDCNIAVSTLGISLDVAAIVHGEIQQDVAQYNVFSSHHARYDGLLHEFSHAAFVISDEALTTVKQAQVMYANVYQKCTGIPGNDPYYCTSSTPDYCRGDCSGCSGSECVPMGNDPSYVRCKPDNDATNLMYLATPAYYDSANWSKFEYKCNARKRVIYIWNYCFHGGC